jgi:hypothetical protein
MTLLKGYAFKQGVLLRDSLIREAGKGNWKPWIPFLILFPAVGEVISDLSQAAKGNTKRVQQLLDDETYEPGNALKRYADNIGAVGGLGLASSLVDQARWGRVKGFLLGPAASDVATTIEAGGALTDAIISGDMKKFQDTLQTLTRGLVPATKVVVPPPSRGGGAVREPSLAPPPPIGR